MQVTGFHCYVQLSRVSIADFLLTSTHHQTFCALCCHTAGALLYAPPPPPQSPNCLHPCSNSQQYCKGCQGTQGSTAGTAGDPLLLGAVITPPTVLLRGGWPPTRGLLPAHVQLWVCCAHFVPRSTFIQVLMQVAELPVDTQQVAVRA